MKGKSRTPLLAAIAVLFVVQAFLHQGFIINQWRKNYGSTGGFVDAGSTEQVLLQMFGFREFLAGILWVRADGFFDEGNYDAVLPMIRLCTLLDPKQLDIYATGMWHIAYNFTDEDQRSDRRYVPAALALGKEGARNNPQTYELFFETGWIWYHKIDDDYHQAVKWFEDAHKRKDIIPGRKNVLTNAYQRNNQIKDALDLYYKLYDETVKRYAVTQEYGDRQLRDTIEGNIDTMVVRMIQRGWLAQQRGDYETGNYDTKPPFDVGFSARATVEDAGVIRVQGTWNVLPVGTRIRFVLRNEEFPGAKAAELNWDSLKQMNLDFERDHTFLQDQLYVKNRKFNVLIDTRKDPTMYPFSSKHKNYVLEFYYNPRSSPPHIQDKFGWNGEGMTDANYINTEVRPGVRVLYASLNLTRDQIKRIGDWTTKVPMVQTKGFDPAKVAKREDEIVSVPSIRTQETKSIEGN
ncbi:MAG TPA: hypothetical protein VEX38_07455 [Fimbriimonadaceae bacterium]|nr:hypothetical protein [Fimbriimonadaceae bacterium]